MLRQNQSVLLALFSNAENNIENIERLMRGQNPISADWLSRTTSQQQSCC